VILEESVLKGIAVLAQGEYATDHGGQAQVSLVAGRGEIQILADGTAWYLNWSADHVLLDVIELTMPIEGSAVFIAAWLVEQADKYKEF